MAAVCMEQFATHAPPRMRRHETTLKFALTRDVTSADVVALRDALNIEGYNTTLLDRSEGGVDFSKSPEVRKDLRFGNSLRGIGTRDRQLMADTLQFAGPMDRIVKKHAAASPPFSAGNELRAYLKYDFSEAESLDVVECMLQCFGVVPDTIYNRGEWVGDCARIAASDSASDINLFLGFELASALSKWTVAEARWPNVLEERLFGCWKCKSREPYFSFSHARATHEERVPHETTFYGLLGCFERGQRVCCDNCYLDLTRCKTSKTRPPRKRRHE